MGSYTPPYVGTSGLVINSYQQILNYIVSGFQSIFGLNVYLGNDSADFQMLSILALLASDGNNLALLVYNQSSPTTAVGGGLSLVVALNGLQRLVPTFSSCLVTFSGTAGTVVNGGVVQNAVTGDLWNLPPATTIGSGGTVTVTAQAQQIGAVNALANQLTIINSGLTAGWTSVTNGSNVPTLGTPVEADAALRTRQAVSTELPSITISAGTIAAILATPGVTGINNSPVLGSNGTPSYENFTGGTDSWGNPAHSVTFVVAGGTNLAVATAIYNNRGLGVLMNGDISGSPTSNTVTVDVTDPNSGIVTPVSFLRPATIPIYVSVNAHPVAGGTLSSAQIAAIQAAVAAYLNTLGIGEVVSYGEVIAAAASVNSNPSIPAISIRNPLYLGTAASPSTSTDIPINFYQVATGSTANVSVTSV